MRMRRKEEDTVAVLYTPVPGATPVPFFFSDRETDKLKRYDLEDLRKTPNQFYALERSETETSRADTTGGEDGGMMSPMMNKFV